VNGPRIIEIRTHEASIPLSYVIAHPDEFHGRGEVMADPGQSDVPPFLMATHAGDLQTCRHPACRSRVAETRRRARSST
jgi:hypothetical protein